MKFAGIDPGAKGAIAIISDMDDTVITIDYDNPSIISARLRAIKPNFAYLEKVSAFPGQGVTSMFNFGTNYGIWQGILSCLSIPYKLITPQKWQKGILYKTDGNDKDMCSINAAFRLFPDAADFIIGPKGKRNKAQKSGRADALMIAYCARRDYMDEK